MNKTRSAPQRLRALRRESKLNWYSLAEILGCSWQSVQRYEWEGSRHHRRPGIKIALAIYDWSKAAGDTIEPREWLA